MILNVSSGRPSRREHLSALVRAGVDELGALQRLAAWHNVIDEPELPLRTESVCAGEQIFPSPHFVPPLVAITIAVLRDLWLQCERESDELLVATFGLYQVTAIHPFINRNGHVALDFAQYLLMNRWGKKAPPLYYESDTHKILGSAFVPMDAPSRDTSETALLQTFHTMLQRLDQTTLASLWTLPYLVAAAHLLAQGSGLGFRSRLHTLE